MTGSEILSLVEVKRHHLKTCINTLGGGDCELTDLYMFQEVFRTMEVRIFEVLLLHKKLPT